MRTANTKNNLNKLQEMLMDEIERLHSLDLENSLFKREIERSKTLSGNAMNYVKSIQTNLNIKEYSGKMNIDIHQLNEEIGNE